MYQILIQFFKKLIINILNLLKTEFIQTIQTNTKFYN